jgi:DNA-binding FadR family transcriptional regulator
MAIGSKKVVAKRKSSASGANGRPSVKLHDMIAVAIGTDIVTGKIAEGSLLPTESVGVEHFSVSRTAYREAIRALAGKGLVSSRPKTGTIVNPRRKWALLDPEILAWIFSRTPSRQSISALFELRMIIEPAAAELAARRRSDTQLKEMFAAFERMRTHGLATTEGRQADGRFHAIILEATENDFLMAMIEPIISAVRLTTQLKMLGESRPRDPIIPHEALLNAIADADESKARAAAIVLLEEAREDTAALLN